MRDPSVVFHEVAHAYVDELAGLPSQGEGGALNEGFADFFAAAIADNPAIGPLRDLYGKTGNASALERLQARLKRSPLLRP